MYGSDYPVPCLNFVVQTSQLARHRLITSEQRVRACVRVCRARVYVCRACVCSTSATLRARVAVQDSCRPPPSLELLPSYLPRS